MMKGNIFKRTKTLVSLVLSFILLLTASMTLLADQPECGEESYVAAQTASNHDVRQPDSQIIDYRGDIYDAADFALAEKWATCLDPQTGLFELSLRITGEEIMGPEINRVNVLLLDYSASMTYNLAGTVNSGVASPDSRLYQLKAAVDHFIDQLTEDDFIAIIIYAQGARIVQPLIQLHGSHKTTAKSSYATPTTQTATNMHAGFIGAYQIMNDPLDHVEASSRDALIEALAKEDTEYNVIFMSDGSPNSYITKGGGDNDINVDWANAPIASNLSGTDQMAKGIEATLLAAGVIKSMAAARGSGAGYNPHGNHPVIYSIGVGASSTQTTVTDQTLIFNPELLSSLASVDAIGEPHYYDTTNYTTMKIFDFIAEKIDSEPSIDGGKLTDIIPAGLHLVGEPSDNYGITVWEGVVGDHAVRFTAAELTISTDGEGNTVVVLENVPSIDLDEFVEMRIPVLVDPTCLKDVATTEDPANPGHYLMASNVSANFSFTNITVDHDPSYPFSVDFAIPLVHVPHLLQDEPPVSYRVVYEPGEHGVFDPVVHEGLSIGEPTPHAPHPLAEPGWVFAGWTPIVSDKVEGDAVYVAIWESTTGDPEPQSPKTADPAKINYLLYLMGIAVIVFLLTLTVYPRRSKPSVEQ